MRAHKHEDILQENHRIVNGQSEQHCCDKTAHEEIGWVAYTVATCFVNVSQQSTETLFGLLDFENLEATVNQGNQETGQRDVDHKDYV